MTLEVVDRVARRADPWIVLHAGDQPSANRIQQQIADHRSGVLLFAQHMVVKSRLPQSTTQPRAPPMPGPLFPEWHRVAEIGVFGRTFEQQVYVIRHHTERDDFEGMLGEEWRYLRGQRAGVMRVAEPGDTPVCRGRDEIAVESDVCE